VIVEPNLINRPVSEVSQERLHLRFEGVLQLQEMAARSAIVEHAAVEHVLVDAIGEEEFELGADVEPFENVAAFGRGIQQVRFCPVCALQQQELQ
jgi:hypothetical protein